MKKTILTPAIGLKLGDEFGSFQVASLLKLNSEVTIGWYYPGNGEIYRETTPSDSPFIVGRNLAKPELREVFVTVAIPKNGNKQFVYGVFTSEDKALDYIENNAPKDCIYATSKELVIQ